MKVRILGCSGNALSVDGVGYHTTAYQVDSHLLVDAGSGALTLSLDEIRLLTDVFISHSHLDHVLALPLMADSRILCRYDGLGCCASPITVHGLPETIDAIRTHLFNDVIFPDFSRIPTKTNPAIRYRCIEPGSSVPCGPLRVTPYQVNHVVPTVGYAVQGLGGSVFFSGDTTTTSAFQQAVSDHDDLEHLIVEMTFPDSMIQLSLDSKHLCPKLLVESIEALDFSMSKRPPKLWTTHAKPDLAVQLATELARHVDSHPGLKRFDPTLLSQGMVLTVGS